jgi:hypothetical protein
MSQTVSGKTARAARLNFVAASWAKAFCQSAATNGASKLSRLGQSQTGVLTVAVCSLLATVAKLITMMTRVRLKQ